MLALLTDAHISPHVAAQVRAKRPECIIYSVRFWRAGILLNAEDDVILAAACEEGLTLVTYDQRTIVPLVKQWMTEGREHAGVLFLDHHGIMQDDIGAQVRALIDLWGAAQSEIWTTVIGYVKPPR